ncbi:MAG: RNA methyltransferase [Bacteroidales bacterium]|nr:RNA methyltransferase [Bacteroidales bacterium]
MLSINKKKHIQQLAQKKQRDIQGLFIAEGPKLVLDLIRGGLIPQIAVGEEDALRDFKSKANTNGKTEYIDATAADMKAISQLKTPSKLLAVFEKPQGISAEEKPQDLVLVLDEIQDPGNLGTIIRIADWFGIRQIICSDTCADAFNPKTIQATMGAIARVGVVETDLTELFKRNKAEWKLPVYGTFLEGTNIYSTTLKNKGFIVMGNEGKGISAAIAPYVSDKLFIPNYPAGEITSESLNVAAATAIVCSEFRRRI